MLTWHKTTLIPPCYSAIPQRDEKVLHLHWQAGSSRQRNQGSNSTTTPPRRVSTPRAPEHAIHTEHGGKQTILGGIGIPMSPLVFNF